MVYFSIGRPRSLHEEAYSRVYTAIRIKPFYRAEGRPCGRPSFALSTGSPRTNYFFFVTPMAVKLKMPYSKSITVSVMPFSHGLRRYLVAE
jgi:hypothetical protein